MTPHDSTSESLTMHRGRLRRRALGRVEIVAVAVVCLLLFCCAWLWLARSRERNRRTVCAAHLRGIAMGAITYSGENEDVWPIIGFDLSNEPEPGFSYIEYVDAIRPDLPQPPDSLPTKASTTACLWMLAREGALSPKSFHCPSSDDEPSDVDEPSEVLWIDRPATDRVPRNDFESYDNCSYGYQIPFGKVGRPHGGLNPHMPVAADKGPFGAALEGGAKNPGVPTAGIDDPAENWRPWNSPNHHGKGQNVLFVDRHVEWAGKPTVGIFGDNIYTRFTVEDEADPTWANRARGLAPAAGAKYAPMDDQDSMIYP